MHNTHHHNQKPKSPVAPSIYLREYVIYLPSKHRESVRRQRRFASLALYTSQSRVERSVAYPLTKIVSIMLFVSLIFSGLSATGGTLSYFSDVEISSGNKLVADPLGFTAVLLGSSTPVDMSVGIQTIVPVITPNADSEPIQYRVTAHMTSGDETLCRGLYLSSTTTFPYDGLLLGLSTEMTTTTGATPFLVTLPLYEPLPVNSSCFVDFVFEARNADALAGQGYADIQHLQVQFFVPAVAPATLIAPRAPEPERAVMLPEAYVSTSTPEAIPVELTPIDVPVDTLNEEETSSPKASQGEAPSPAPETPESVPLETGKSDTTPASNEGIQA